MKQRSNGAAAPVPDSSEDGEPTTEAIHLGSVPSVPVVDGRVSAPPRPAAAQPGAVQPAAAHRRSETREERRARKRAEQRKRETPDLDPDLTLGELEERRDDAKKRQKLIVRTMWAITIAVMIYGAINVTLTLGVPPDPTPANPNPQPYISWPLALMLSAIVDAALCIALWADRFVRDYAVKSGWINTLRLSTGFLTLALNDGVYLADWLSPNPRQDSLGQVLIHAVGPIVLIIAVEATAAITRKLTSIERTLGDAVIRARGRKRDEQQELVELRGTVEERDRAIAELSAEQERLGDELETTGRDLEEQQRAGGRMTALILDRYSPIHHGTPFGEAILRHLQDQGVHRTLIPYDDEPLPDQLWMVDMFARRLIVIQVSADTLTMVDMEKPDVKRVLMEAEAERPQAELLGAIRPHLMVTIRAADLEQQAFALQHEEEDTSERETLLNGIVRGTVENVSRVMILRLIIRAALSTRRIREDYTPPRRNTGRRRR